MSSWRHSWRCDGVRRVVVFIQLLLKEFGELMKCFHFFLSPTFENGDAGEGFWRACVNSRAAMVEFYVDDMYGIFL